MVWKCNVKEESCLTSFQTVRKVGYLTIALIGTATMRPRTVLVIAVTVVVIEAIFDLYVGGCCCR